MKELIALLDAQGMFIGNVDKGYEPKDGESVLPQIINCDITDPGYYWEAQEGNPFGGAFIKPKNGIPSGLMGAPEVEYLFAELVRRFMPEDPRSKTYLEWHKKTIEGRRK